MTQRWWPTWRSPSLDIVGGKPYRAPHPFDGLDGEEFEAAWKRAAAADKAAFLARKREDMRPSHHRRRARKRANGGSFTAYEWRMAVQKYSGLCFYCAKRPRGQLEIEHRTPLDGQGDRRGQVAERRVGSPDVREASRPWCVVGDASMVGLER